MARSKLNPATSVTFRMPDAVLQTIDKLAIENSHDRTAEINVACRHWIEIGGILGNETITQKKVHELKEELIQLNKRLEIQESVISQLTESMNKLEKNNTTLLSVIESNERTIQRLLETIPQSG